MTMIDNYKFLWNKKTGKKLGFQNLGVGEEIRVFGQNIYQWLPKETFISGCWFYFLWNFICSEHIESLPVILWFLEILKCPYLSASHIGCPSIFQKQFALYTALVREY